VSDGRVQTDRIDQWGAAWGVAGLSARVRVEMSPRLRRSLGRAQPERGVIRLAADLEAAPRELFDEVLCHELAHVAVHLIHGRGSRPHGPEWAELMHRAGFPPRARFDARELPPELALRAGLARRRAPLIDLHACPVCRASRLARRPVRGWRCAACIHSGRDGRLTIARLDEEARQGLR
jgi:hypothetical protein